MKFIYIIYIVCCRCGRAREEMMDQRAAEMVADLYESKLFDATSIGRRFGIPHQRVVAVADRVRREKLVAYWSRVHRENPGRSLTEFPVDP